MPKTFEIRTAALGTPTSRNSVIVITAFSESDANPWWGEYYLLKPLKRGRVQGNRLTFDRRTSPVELGPILESSFREEVYRQAEIDLGDFFLKNSPSTEPSGILQGEIAYQTPKPLPFTCQVLLQFPEEIAFVQETSQCQKLVEHLRLCKKINYEKKGIPKVVGG